MTMSKVQLANSYKLKSPSDLRDPSLLVLHLEIKDQTFDIVLVYLSQILSIIDFSFQIPYCSGMC